MMKITSRGLRWLCASGWKVGGYSELTMILGKILNSIPATHIRVGVFAYGSASQFSVSFIHTHFEIKPMLVFVLNKTVALLTFQVTISVGLFVGIVLCTWINI